MDLLVDATLPYGLIPPVVPEFPGITVGGGFAGTAGESSSFKYGFLDRSVNWVEVVLADGKVVVASEKENADLFRGLAGTFGTLGVTTLFEIRLIPAKPFVELSYLRVDSIEHAQDVIKHVAEDEAIDFLDGIMFSPESGVIMAGRFAERDEKNHNLPVVTFSKPWDQWFYLHAEERMKRTSTSCSASISSPGSPSIITANRDLIPLTDYLFRYDRGAFWTGWYAYEWFVIPFNRVTRWLLDRFMHTRVMYHALHRSGMMQRFIIQDMAVPNENVPAFSAWLDAELPRIYPRWLCPLKVHGGAGADAGMNPHVIRSSASATTSSSSTATTTTTTTEGEVEEETLLNIGVWGRTPRHKLQVPVNRRIEAQLHSLRGTKWLYAQTFYTESEFWQIYNRTWYEALRQKYRAASLPTVYDKVRTRFEFNLNGNGNGNDASGREDDVRLGIEKGFWSVWPFAGIYGVLSTLKGGDYLRKQ